MYIYICVCVCMYTLMSGGPIGYCSIVCVYVCMYVCMYVYAHKHIRYLSIRAGVLVSKISK